MGPERIQERLRTYPLFQNLPDELLEALARAIEVRTVPPGRIFNQGDTGEIAMALYIVARGRVAEWRVDETGREVFRRVITEGGAFGYRGVLDGSMQLSSAEVMEPSVLFRLSAADFTRLQAQYPVLVEALLRPNLARRLRAMPFLGGLTDEQLWWMVDLFHHTQVAPGQTIFTLSRPEPAICLIDYGQIIAHGGAVGHAVFTAGHYIGRHPVLGARRATVARAVTQAALFSLTTAELEWLLSAFPEVQTVLQRPPDIVHRLRQTHLFARLVQAELEALAGYVCWEHCPARRAVTQQGEPGDAFYILDYGEALVRAVDERGQERPRDFLVPGRYFGETSLILKEPRDATVEAITPTDWLVLYHDDLKQFLKEHPEVRERLQLREETRRKLQELSKARQTEETIVFRSRRHWWPLFARIAFPLLFLFITVPVLIVAIGLRQRLGPLLEEATIGLGLLTISYILWVVFDWRNDWLIVTTRRVIHQERLILISESRIEAPLEKIQDINIRRNWLANLFGYGTLIIQTAATVGRIEFRYLGNPETVQQLIWEQVARARAGAQAESREQIRRELEERLGLGLSPTPSHAAHPEEPGPAPARKPWWRRIRLRRWLLPIWVEEGDRITWRKHPLNLLMRTARPLLLSAGVGALTWLALQNWAFLQRSGWDSPTFLVLTLAWMVALGWLAWEYDDWRNDVYIVTRDRIIDIEKKPLFFSEDRREASLGMIQNVTANIPSPLAFIFGYGDVTIQTAAEMGTFDFVFVPNPREVQAEISRRVEAFRAEQAARAQAQRQAELAAWFETYHRLRREHSH